MEYKMNLNKLAKEVHEDAKAKGFYDEPREDETLLILIICELAEAVEADRNNRSCKCFDFDQNLFNDREFKHLFEKYAKDTIEDELADAMIRILDFAGYKGIDILTNPKIVFFFNTKSFPEKLFLITGLIINNRNGGFIPDSFRYLAILCVEMKIDWQTHIKLKMRYNKLREHKNGKEY